MRRAVFERAALVFALILLWYVLFNFLLGPLTPIVIGFLIALATERVTLLLTRWMPRWLATLVSVTLAAAVLLGGLGWLGYRLLAEVSDFAASFDARRLSVELEGLIPGQLAPWVKPLKGKAIEEVLAAASNLLRAALGSIVLLPEAIIGSVITLMAAYLIALNLPRYWEAFLGAFTNQWQTRILSAVERTRRAFVGYWLAQGSLSAMSFVLALIVLVQTRETYALTLSALAALSEMIPVIGATAFFVPFAGYLFLVGKTALAWSMLMVYAVVGVARRLVEAKIIGDAAEISPLAAVVSILVGLKLAGVLGVFLGPALWTMTLALAGHGEEGNGPERSRGEVPPVPPAQ